MSKRILAASLVLAAAVMPAGFAQSGAPAAQAPAAPAPVPNCPELATALTRVLGQDARLRDWANLARYREANRSVTRADVVFMGDSITDSWQNPRYGFFTAAKPYVDRGISAQTTPQMLLRFRADVVELRPKVVVILAGTNDIAGNTGPMTDAEIQGNLTSMSEIALANKIKVVLSSITPVSSYHLANPNANPQTSQRPMPRIRAINDWIKGYAERNGHVYLDYFSAMTDEAGLLRAELSSDDLHPNEAGYRIMGPLVEAAIAKALK